MPRETTAELLASAAAAAFCLANFIASAAVRPCVKPRRQGGKTKAPVAPSTVVVPKEEEPPGSSNSPPLPPPALLEPPRPRLRWEVWEESEKELRSSSEESI